MHWGHDKYPLLPHPTVLGLVICISNMIQSESFIKSLLRISILDFPYLLDIRRFSLRDNKPKANPEFL